MAGGQVISHYDQIRALPDGPIIEDIGGLAAALAGKAVPADVPPLVWANLRARGIHVVTDPEYGAVLDGATNNTAANRAAVNAAIAASGIAYSPPGVNFTDEIPVNGSNVGILGAGRGLSMFKLRSNRKMPVFYSDETAQYSNIHIADLTIDGNRENQTMTANGVPVDGNAMGVRVGGWANSSIRRVEIKNCGTDGLYLTGWGAGLVNPTTDLEVEYLRTTNCRRNGLSVICATDLDVSHSRFDGNGFDSGVSPGTMPKAGVDIERNSDDQPLERLKFVGCRTEGNAENGFMVYEAYGHLDDLSLEIINHRSRNNGGWGLHAYSFGGVFELHRLTVNGGRWSGNGDGGMWLRRVIRGGVSGALFVSAGERAVYIGSESMQLNLDNLIVRCSSPAATTIEIDPGCTMIDTGVGIQNEGRTVHNGTRSDSLPMAVANSGGSIGSGYRAGYWFTTPADVSTSTPPNGQTNTSPIHLPKAGTITDMAVEITTAGAVGSVVRLGVYIDDGNGAPGELLLDAGTVDSTTIGVKTLALDGQSGRPSPLWVPAGRYWLVGVPQGTPATNPSVRVNAGPSPGVGATAASAISSRMAGWQQAGITGALPATFTTTPAVTPSATRVAVKLG